ncbi:MAG TPA: fumarate hydratase C-terminal domain-containing protein [bacterium]|nr:fumarate hydratase C-terminal domain-containing protein [bacterium]HPN32600.1 fumarate hydratase C-terminal domain-containing protein [bacterium]
MKKIILPLTKKLLKKNNNRGLTEISGDILVARDQAHKRIFDSIKSGLNLSFPLQNQTIFFAGPSPAPPGKIIGSIGPTTSARMEKYMPFMVEMGVTGFIGKGQLTCGTLQKIKGKALYFTAFGGVAALLSKYVVKSETIAYSDLGAEAVLKLTVKNFPVII